MYEVEDLPFGLDVLSNHRHVEVLNRVYVLARFVVDTTKHENLFTIEGTRRVVVSASVQIRQVLPLVGVDIIHFTRGAGADSSTRDSDEVLSHGARRVTVPWVLHICSHLEHKSISLLEELAALNVRFSILILKVATTDHKDLGVLANLNDLEVVR